MRQDVQPTAWGPQSWVVAVVAGNSFGHYREHAAEMGITETVTRKDIEERGLDGW
jgi:hypothetical protein